MSKLPIPPLSRQDLLIFQGLQRALVEKKATVQINFKRLNKFKSPFFNPWENVLPLLVVIFISMALMIFDNLIIGTVTFLALSIVYALCMPYFLEPFMHNRVLRRIVPRIEKFLIAWRYGGFSLVLAADPRYSCQAPAGDWRQFTQAYFSDLIPQDLGENDRQQQQ